MVKSLFLFCIVLFAFFERIFAIQLGDYRVGLFDISALSFVIYSLVSKVIISTKALLLFLVLLVIQIIALLNSNPVSYTAVLTVGLKIFLVYYLFILQIKPRHLLITGSALFIIFGIILVAFSDGAIIYPTDYFNRNETLAYLLMSIFLIDEKFFKTRSFLLLVLVFLTFIVQSRQIVISFGVVLFLSIFFSNKISKVYKMYIILFVMLFVLTFIPFMYSQFDDYTLRRYNVFFEFGELDLSNVKLNKDVTQGDKYRILNILSGLEGWLNSPIYGHGLGSYVRLNEFGKVAHNSYVTLLFEGGLVLFSTFIYLIYYYSRYINEYLTSVIFFSMLVSLNFIESLGKLPVYFYFGIILMKMNSFKYTRRIGLTGKYCSYE